MKKDFLKVTTILCGLSALPFSLLAKSGSGSMSGDDGYVHKEGYIEESGAGSFGSRKIDKKGEDGSLYGRQTKEKGVYVDKEDERVFMEKSNEGFITSTQNGESSSIERDDESSLNVENSIDLDKDTNRYIVKGENTATVKKSTDVNVMPESNRIKKSKNADGYIDTPDTGTVYFGGGADKDITKDVDSDTSTIEIGKDKYIRGDSNSINVSKDLTVNKTGNSSDITITTSANDTTTTKNIKADYHGDGTTTYTGESGQTVTRTMDSNTGDITFSSNGQSKTVTPPSRPRRAKW